MSPGSIVFRGIGHWMSPIFQPCGSFHFSSVGRPASPEKFQYVCQPGTIRSNKPMLNGLPGTTAFVSAKSSALTSCFPWYVWAVPLGATAKIPQESSESRASFEADGIQLRYIRCSLRQSVNCSRFAARKRERRYALLNTCRVTTGRRLQPYGTTKILSVQGSLTLVPGV